MASCVSYDCCSPLRRMLTNVILYYITCVLLVFYKTHHNQTLSVRITTCCFCLYFFNINLVYSVCVMSLDKIIKKSVILGTFVCMHVCLQTSTLSVISDPFKLQCLYYVCLFLRWSTFKWHQYWPCDLNPGRPSWGYGVSQTNHFFFNYFSFLCLLPLVLCPKFELCDLC